MTPRITEAFSAAFARNDICRELALLAWFHRFVRVVCVCVFVFLFFQGSAVQLSRPYNSGRNYWGRSY